MDRALVGLFHPLPSLATVAASLAFTPLLARGLPPPTPVALLALTLAFHQFSISAHNDWCDRALDATAKPRRAIPSGAISAPAALALALALAVSSLLLALPLGLDEVALVALALACGALYNLRVKRTPVSWLPFSIAFPLIPLFAAAALDVWPPWWPAVALAAQPLIVAIHLSDSIPDIETDSRSGARGLASVLGLRLARRLRTAGFVVSALAVAAIALAYLR
ncbi:MAG: UbiA family prenyltransferase [Chloroflexota bacterium]